MIKPSYYDAVSAIVGNNKLCGGYSNGPLNKIVFVEGFNDLPTEEAIQAKLKELEKQYADNEYQRKRLEEYNAIGLGEQLDMIYHDMDGWKAKIKAVKDKYPKPSE